jgi:hypothetical protein
MRSLLVLPGLLKDALCEAQHTKVLIDGFPRVFDQLKEFEKQVSTWGLIVCVDTVCVWGGGGVKAVDPVPLTACK